MISSMPTVSLDGNDGNGCDVSWRNHIIMRIRILKNGVLTPKIRKTLGMRTFWDLQQNQEIHKDADWQEKMVEIELRVSDMDWV